MLISITQYLHSYITILHRINAKEKLILKPNEPLKQETKQTAGMSLRFEVGGDILKVDRTV